MRKLFSISAIVLVSSLLAAPAMAAKTDTYNCDGQKIKVSFPDDQIAVMYYGDELIVLKEAISASGARYVGENFQIWTKGKDDLNLATISEDDAVNGRVAEDNGRTCQLVK
ncbi:periplasmic lysozyme inhibitor of c-type lysozyme [Proteus hauseri ATCC 700826]|uniref:Periplasmic lysozyme inhibitor of c-type lysozyme n=1 Tax=Proteus hauseri ATCC 700826 TaxID=1354271 RepID=A0AAJ3HSJ8_PROHU|nr:MliC family protein [Proteus hauseri]OAT47051.1 periplasmic lysozyme inhibitor of c-type lysozyme [Proteus hauseri ATCC 700826]